MIRSLAKRSAIASLAAYSRFQSRADQATDDPAILVQSMGGIGNTLMATPFLSELRRLYPESRIDLMTTPGAAALLGATRLVDNVIVDDASAGLRAYVATQRIVADGDYDIAILTRNALLFRAAVRSVLAGVPRRIIHRYEFRSSGDFTTLFTDRLSLQPGQHDCESNLDILRVALEQEEVDSPPIHLELPSEAYQRARERLQRRGWSVGELAIGLCPGCSSWMRDKRWPMDSYAELARRAVEAWPEARVFALCGPDDTREAEFLRAQVNHDRFDVVDDLDIQAFAASLSLFRVAVCNDSLPMHICAGLQAPVVALFGPTDPSHVGPWKCPSRIITSPCDYAPYFTLPDHPDMARDDPCMSMISVDSVFGAVAEFVGDEGESRIRGLEH